MDKLTLNINRIISILLLRNPIKFSFGVLLGLFLYCLSIIFEPFLKSITFIESSVLSLWVLLIIGIFILFISDIIKQVFKTQKFSLEIEEAFEVLKLLKKEGASQTELNILYRKICTLVHNNLLNQNKKNKVDSDFDLAT